MMRLLGHRVLVLLPPKPTVQEETTGYTFQKGRTTASGLTLAKPPSFWDDECATRGLVVQVSGTVEVEPGDCVVFAPHVGERIVQDGLAYLILYSDQVAGVLEPLGREQQWLDRLAELVTRTQGQDRVSA